MPGLAVRRDDGAYVIPGFLLVRGDSVLQALPRPGQVALARAVRVQGLAVKDQPDARLRPGPEDQQAVFRLGGIIDRLPDDAAVDLTQINACGRRRPRLRGDGLALGQTVALLLLALVGCRTLPGLLDSDSGGVLAMAASKEQADGDEENEPRLGMAKGSAARSDG